MLAQGLSRRIAAAVVFAASSILVLAVPAAAERKAVVTEGADYFGKDISTLKDVALEACEQACVADSTCKAFTYNTKARWCFLKADHGELRPFAGAVAGRIVEGGIAGPDLAATRKRELAFLSTDAFDEADRIAKAIAETPAGGPLGDLEASAANLAMNGSAFLANAEYKKALALAPDRFDLWEAFVSASLAASHDDWEQRSRLAAEAVAGSVQAYLRAVDDDERARALNLIAQSYAKQEVWRRAIKAARLSVSVKPDPIVQGWLDDWIAQHGFRVVDNTVDTSAELPRICATFSEEIAWQAANITDFVSVEGGDKLAIEAAPTQICAAGVTYGDRYRMTVRQGLPAADGEETLHKTVEIDMYVRDRDPQVRFLSKAYVLPRHADSTIPVASVNVDTIRAEVVRIGERSLVGLVQDGSFLRNIGGWETSDYAERRGEKVWEGTVGVSRDTNKEVVTAIPVGELVPALKPGVYALTARGESDTYDWAERATQWFIVTDLGLSTMTGNDGLHSVVRSLGSAAAVEGTRLTLVAVNNEILGTATTDANGYARFDAGLVKGTGGGAPAMLVAEGNAGDFAFLDLQRSAFDLTDRGVEGRDPPKPVDVFVTPERGIYRVGETVNLTALARDPAARAEEGIPLTVVVTRPDGVEYLRRLAGDEGAGGRDISFALPEGAMRGTWRADVHTDPEQAAVAQTTFLVEDFLPERIDFAFDLGDKPLVAGDPVEIPLSVEWLYGAPAAGLTIEGEVYVTRAEGASFAPGFVFGIEGEEFSPVAEPISGDPTAEDGTTVAQATVPYIDSSMPLQAAVHVRVIDTNGRPVERRQVLPVTTTAARIGVDPAFDGAVGEGETARFAVAVFDDAGQKIAADGLTWSLSRVNRHWQWYMVDGTWNYEGVETTELVANGSVDAVAGGNATIEAAVQWGEYRLSVEDPNGNLIALSTTFEAGWYVPPGADPAPDLLKLTLDKEKYAVGETLTARIHPRFPGVAVVQVIDDRLIDMKTVEVGEDGATVSLEVTGEWGPGAYVTATLLRPMDLPSKRMPQRALGLAWATVDPGERLLDVSLSIPTEMRPGTSLPVEVALANVPAGEEAFVTIAAVDVGILNLTGFEAPAPEDWYFAQRRLGVELRDVYGQLIDTMIGARGDVRSGGDGSGINRLAGPPPTERLVAFYQGVTRVDADGKARAAFDIPDFNGSVKVMAIAWTKSGVGHAAGDVLVRDPVVIMSSLPNFLAPGDSSRLRLDFTHVDGPSGEFTLSVAAAGDLVDLPDDFAARKLTLDAKASAVVEVPLKALEVGDETVTVALTTPGGDVLTRVLTVPVRANEPAVMRVSSVELAAGNGKLTVSPDLIADYVPGTAVATVTVGGVSGIDLPGLVRQLDKYPYGCTEQITSRALPLVYLDDVVLAAGLSGEEPVRERVQRAIEDILINQASNGSFGLWGPGGEDLWLDAYVTDFLTRAREKGYEVPVVAFDMAVTNLKNRIAYAADFASGGEDIAYALYVLARNGRASIGDLRYFAEQKMDAFGTPLAKAQVGAALALYGDTVKASAAFRVALGDLDQYTYNTYRADYGSDLRDGAAILTLASETRADGVDLEMLARQLGTLGVHDVWRSTQEQAWMLLAAHSLLTDGRKLSVTVDGKPHEGVFTASYDADDLAGGGVVVENKATFTSNARVTVTGVPASPEPAGGNGFTIARRFFTLDGTEIDPSRLELGQRVLVVLTVTATSDTNWARVMIDDPLPAGLVIDNPSLLTGADTAMIDWLTLEAATAATEFRADRFLSAVDLKGDRTEVSVGYMARAIAPGDYAYPAAVVEDMYRPYMRARTGSGRMTVATGG